ncbi:MAG TPA: hypothetical protein VMF09_14660 [Solirubrobacteraceae bacterium]|nr:hypothetical protein [Solirubrobacteraceae bacterium]
MLSGDYPADMYVIAKCSARRQAAAAIVLLPFSLTSFVLDARASLKDSGGFLGILVALLSFVILIPLTLIRAWEAFACDPLVIEGDVSELQKTRFGSDESIGLFFRLTERRRLRIKVTYTARIGRRGFVTPSRDVATFLGQFVGRLGNWHQSELPDRSQAPDVLLMSVSGGVYRAVTEGSTSILLCTSSGHGIAILSKRPEASWHS